MMKYSAYVVTFRGQYLRFGRYSTAIPVDNPLLATLYSRQGDAKRRLGEPVLFIRGLRFSGEHLQVKLVTMELVEESDPGGLDEADLKKLAE